MRISNLTDDDLVMTGFELVQTMIDDWQLSDTQKFTNYFSQVGWIEKDKLYRVDPEVTCIEEVEK